MNYLVQPVIEKPSPEVGAEGGEYRKDEGDNCRAIQLHDAVLNEWGANIGPHQPRNNEPGSLV